MNHAEQQAAAVNTDLDGEEKYAAALQRVTPSVLRLLHAAMGICTEGGELVDQLKKHIFYGAPLDRVNLFEEAGDCSWYLRVLADELADLARGKCSFEEMIDRNIAKLKVRYPEKFTEEAARNRNLAAERKVLEGR